MHTVFLYAHGKNGADFCRRGDDAPLQKGEVCCVWTPCFGAVWGDAYLFFCGRVPFVLAGAEPDLCGRARAQSQVTLALPAPRGGFYDCRNRPLTGLHQTWQAVCIPGQDSYGRLYRYAGPEQQSLLYQQRNARRPFLVELEQDLSQQGIRCFPVTQRYGAAPLACHLLGYLDGEEQGVGRAGSSPGIGLVRSGGAG